MTSYEPNDEADEMAGQGGPGERYRQNTRSPQSATYTHTHAYKHTFQTHMESWGAMNERKAAPRERGRG